MLNKSAHKAVKKMDCNLVKQDLGIVNLCAFF